MKKNKYKNGVVLGSALILLIFPPASVHAQSLTDAVLAARQNDAQYSADMAGVRSRHAQAQQSATAYLPYAGLTYTRSDLSNGGYSYKTVSLIQPLLSYDRYLSVKQADDLEGLADTDSRLAYQSMVLRVFSAMAEIIRQREAIRSGQAQIDGLADQSQRAQRMFQLGQGTVTEVSDFGARLASARANQISLQNSLENAILQFTHLTGLTVDVPSISVDVEDDPVGGRSLADLTAYVRENSVAVQQARHNMQLAQISVKKVRAQYVPQIYAQAARVQYGSSQSITVNQIGVSLSATLGAPQYYEDRRSAFDLEKAEESLESAKKTAISDLVKTYSAWSALGIEIKAREESVAAARQAVSANVRSYQAGIKSNSDVFLSYQALADAENQLVKTSISFKENAIKLSLMIN